jgi:hypothetical protein
MEYVPMTVNEQMRYRRFMILGLATALTLTTASIASAQNGPSKSDQSPIGTPGINPPEDNGTASRGVIKPPATGDAINKGAPPSNEFPTPVIPPPGSPGGDPKVVPK